MAAMQLRHFSDVAITKVRKQASTSWSVEVGMKPLGFWVSDESDHGWKEWCEDENFNLDRLVYEHEVTLAKGAKILYLRSDADIDAFADKYKADSVINRAVANIGPKYGLPSTIHEINWPAVAKVCQGIIITPYCYGSRMGRHMWYYGWDCASGCIWDTKAIAKVELLRRNPVPPGWKPFNHQEWAKNMKATAAKAGLKIPSSWVEDKNEKAS